ncbi:hypothetical protein E2C01_025679 [Portunus trituberculatus]|uniref:Uncharacterized protein n=1 Tax=Portunus trituberculatus TaxID=210409 RepID=A0A5B7EGK7_PORTR|nr:hypothetical protein [Portunus trituberculatus]
MVSRIPGASRTPQHRPPHTPSFTHYSTHHCKIIHGWRRNSLPSLVCSHEGVSLVPGVGWAATWEG